LRRNRFNWPAVMSMANGGGAKSIVLAVQLAPP
jgi:hypothetical protein